MHNECLSALKPRIGGMINIGNANLRDMTPKKQLPLVSIIIPCYKYWKYLEDAISSCLNSSYLNQEIIVIDDFSPDSETKDHLKRLQKKYPQLKWLLLDKNVGVSWARNTWISESRGKYILCLDADDLVNAETISLSVDILESHPEYGFAYGNYEIFWTHEGVITVPKFSKSSVLFKKNYAHPSSLFNKQVWIDVGGYDENRKNKFEDLDFWLMANKKWYYWHKSDFVGIKYRQHQLGRNVEAGTEYFTNMYFIARKHRSILIFLTALAYGSVQYAIRCSKNIGIYNKLSPFWQKYVLGRDRK